MRKRIAGVMTLGIEFGFYVSLYFFVQFPNYPLYYQAFGSMIALFFWLIQSLLEQRLVYKHFPWNLWILLLNAWIWLGMVWSIDPGKTLLYSLVFTNGSIFMVLLSSCIGRKSQMIRIVTFILLIGTIFAIKAVLPTLPIFIQNFKSSASFADKFLFRIQGGERIKSSMGDANSVGGLYAILITLILPLLMFGFRTVNKVKRSFWMVGLIFLGKLTLQIIGWGLVGIFVVTLMMSASRGAMFGLVGSLLIVFLVHNHFVSNINFGLLSFSGILFPSFQLALYSLYSGIVDETRYVIFQNALEVAKMVSFTGLGLGNFAPAYWYFFHEEFNHAHNIYINTAVELGIPGLILFTVLVACFVYFGALYTRQKKDPLLYAINMSLTSVVFGFLVRCLVDYTI